MSDRGYIALSLEIRAKAIEARIHAMLVANKERERHGEAPAYPDEHFFTAEKDLNVIVEEIRVLANH